MGADFKNYFCPWPLINSRTRCRRPWVVVSEVDPEPLLRSSVWLHPYVTLYQCLLSISSTVQAKYIKIYRDFPFLAFFILKAILIVYFKCSMSNIALDALIFTVFAPYYNVQVFVFAYCPHVGLYKYLNHRITHLTTSKWNYSYIKPKKKIIRIQFLKTVWPSQKPINKC